jgi:hypothetical protein
VSDSSARTWPHGSSIGGLCGVLTCEMHAGGARSDARRRQVVRRAHLLGDGHVMHAHGGVACIRMEGSGACAWKGRVHAQGRRTSLEMGHVKVEWEVKRGPSSNSRGKVLPASQIESYLPGGGVLGY